MRKNSTAALGAALTATLLLAGAAEAGISPQEAAKLGHELTPFGAEKAGNKDGSIPAWDGGLTKALVPSTGPLPADQYPNEKPLFVIDQKNVAQYAGKLSEGQKALIAKYPDYHLTVYPSHRTFAAPQWVYDNDLKNAVNGQLGDNGQSVKGVYGGTPFPMPKSGIELYWNHTLRYVSPSNSYRIQNFTGNSDGSVTMTVSAIDNHQSPYYEQDGSADKWDGEYAFGRLQNVGPAFKAGEMLVIRDSVDPSTPRQAWQYLVGQRRVRRAPTVGYDTPDFVASGANYFDEVFGFWGAPDRYDWKLIGKQEIYVPYNDNAFFQLPSAQALTAHFPNADKLRWELHRVWVVELSLASGKRHVVPKKRVYFDEDSYAALMTDGYDADGKLWRTAYMLPLNVADGGYDFIDTTIVHNLQAGTYSAIEVFNDGYYKNVAPRPDSFFTGDSLASEGVR
ncbi:hypothetical protein GCM10011611_57920 [Aliidongia dinghuensis]|uniref:DUF1329 domain-containing protein n=1 Tax=Aliidongia dinghuensis TaxID=1867774 RepID=A0A8J3E6F6_9PROT|nr:DUF1329 domain-containing protein [Aliidongia dinghuensis]GGF43937.1 hypothetical protein GCM10011611_57920 [Aliidongia dinghuensis]